MIRLKYFGILLLTWFTLISFIGINEDISAALKSGNAFKIAAFFQDKVDITVLDQSDLLSKLEAEKLIYNFFHAHQPSDFEILHEGKSKTGLEYTIGTLKTNNGNFRVSIYVNKTTQSEYIQQLFIDAE